MLYAHTHARTHHNTIICLQLINLKTLSQKILGILIATKFLFWRYVEDFSHPVLSFLLLLMHDTSRPPSKNKFESGGTVYLALQVVIWYYQLLLLLRSTSEVS